MCKQVHASLIYDVIQKDIDLTQFRFLDIILKVRPLTEGEIQNVQDESTLISFLYPAQNQNLIQKLAAKKVNAFGKFKIL